MENFFHDYPALAWTLIGMLVSGIGILIGVIRKNDMQKVDDTSNKTGTFEKELKRLEDKMNDGFQKRTDESTKAMSDLKREFTEEQNYIKSQVDEVRKDATAKFDELKNLISNNHSIQLTAIGDLKAAIASVGANNNDRKK